MGERYRGLLRRFSNITRMIFQTYRRRSLGKYLVMLSGGAGSSPGLSETRVQPPRYSAVRIGTVVHRAISRLFENCLPFEGGKRMPLHRLFEQRGENFVQQRSYAAEFVRTLPLFRSDGTENLSQRGGTADFQTSRLKSAKHECHRGLFLFPVLRKSATKTCAI